MQAQDMIAGNWYILTSIHNDFDWICNFNHINSSGEIIVNHLAYMGEAISRKGSSFNVCHTHSIKKLENAPWILIAQFFPEEAKNYLLEYQIY